MRVSWTDILDTAADALNGKDVELRGWPATAEPAATAAYLLLTPEPVCCAGCLPSDPLRCVEVFANDPLPLEAGPLRLRGRWRRLVADPNGWRYQLTDARPVTEGMARRPAFPGIGRRQVLASPLLCLAAMRPANAAAQEDAHAWLAERASVDVHSHAGALLRLGQAGTQPPFEPVAEPMRTGGLAVTCLAVVSDMPTHRIGPDRRIRAFRDPAPGELGLVRGEVAKVGNVWRVEKAKHKGAHLGHYWRIVLCSAAVAIVSRRMRGLRPEQPLFSIKGSAAYTRFRKACRLAGGVGLRTHDLRHEGLSRMADAGLNLGELQAQSGHRSAQMLMRYLNGKAKDIAAKLG